MAARGTGTRLTDAAIKKLKLPEKGKRREVFDSGQPGLALRITHGGAMSWVAYYRRQDGRNAKITLGRYPVLSLAEARRKAADAKADPNPLRTARIEAAREAAQGDDSPTFGEIAERYIVRKVSKLKRGADERRMIEMYLLPAWRDRPLTELRKRDAVKVVEAIMDAGKLGMARAVMGLIMRIGRWALNVDAIDSNPFGGLAVGLAEAHNELRRPTRRERVLNDDELKAVWAAADVVGYPFGDLAKLILLTGARRNEAGEMVRGELDTLGSWIIPGDRTKSARELVLPLSDLALDVLGTAHDFLGPYIFTSRDGERPVSGYSKALATLRRKSGVEGWTWHDLRRTMRTGLKRVGVDTDIAELTINHAPPPLIATYDRHDYYTEKAAALQNWADELRVIVGLASPPGDKVVSIRNALQAV